MHTFFIEKIIKIRNSFKSYNISPIEILNKLIPKNKNEFFLPYITTKEMIKYIKKLKSSNSHGHDHITNKILKLINNEISPYLVHLINSIIRTQIFPDIYKISRITPLSKPDKDDKLPSSYRPINNLPAIEKLIETHILTHLIPFLEVNNIIHNNHHGGRHSHSTTTALTNITHKLNHN